MKRVQLLLLLSAFLAASLSCGAGPAAAVIGGMRAGKRGACEQNLKALGDLIQVYVLTESGALPEADNAAGLAEFGDFSQCATRHSKSDKESEDPVEKDNSYIYLGGFDLDQLADLANTPLIFDKPGNNHVNVLFADMHVEAFKKDDLKTVTAIVEFLNTEKKFDDALYQELLTKAATVDKALGYVVEVDGEGE